MKRALVLVYALLLGVSWAPAVAGVTGFKSGTFDPPRMAPAIALQGSDGSELKLERYRGKVVALGFGFTHCPEICPTTLSRLAKARRSLGEAGRDLQVVYVTVDPQRDSPGQMRTYLAHFDASFVGGTGTAAQLDRVYREFGVIGGQNHSTFVYLIDREGRIRAMVPYGKSAEDMAHDARILLAK